MTLLVRGEEREILGAARDGNRTGLILEAEATGGLAGASAIGLAAGRRGAAGSARAAPEITQLLAQTSRSTVLSRSAAGAIRAAAALNLSVMSSGTPSVSSEETISSWTSARSW
ncbi:hypothetical protein HMPREF9336_04235 [Segniliparus rugosus ATCC BAA-974]|uniref:Uncharacterized protein n=1 Tax=Segniliparus rugosus (strain ATCC BAA-974 / DSM 45345 / CCUG 50838 / CIP 108380 / JCM 13579 / CDC 945) TaxID=679197 RepID=U1N5B3_SEGRC|nr:hypothetical protein HMPREF9336_04235 [Segniliparus rugosus ATCC BAA-974]